MTEKSAKAELSPSDPALPTFAFETDKWRQEFSGMLLKFARAVRTPRNEMPPYSLKLLSDADLADVHAFVAARPRPHQLPR